MAKKRKVDDEEPSNPDPNSNDSTNGDSSDSDSPSEELTKILEPFTKDQLINLLRTAASNDPKTLEEIHRVADLEPSHRKLFVHGLGWETTTEILREFFAQYGEIEDCKVVADKSTGKSKGYGFLLFKHRKSAQKALKEPQKKIESRMTACQLASAGPVNLPNFGSQQENVMMRKIYVGNVHSGIAGDRLRDFFSKFGEIEEGPLGFDKQTGKPKGYALFIYKTIEGVKKVLEEPSKIFDGHQLYCQKASENHKQKGGGNAASGSTGVAGGEFNISGGGGGGGYNAGALGSGGGGGGYNANAGAMGAAPGMFGQGFMGGAQQFGQGVQPIQAALAVLAAAGQNPAAFGVPPAVVASLNPALAAVMNAGQPAVGSVGMQQTSPGFGMTNPGYQNPPAHHGNNSYQVGATGQGSGPRPYSAMGQMGGYSARWFDNSDDGYSCHFKERTAFEQLELGG